MNDDLSHGRGNRIDFLSTDDSDALKNLISESGVLPGEVVADFEFGHDFWPVLLEGVGPEGFLSAFDFSCCLPQAMKPLNPNLEILSADIHSLPVEDSRFDHVFCFDMFADFDYKEKALAEIHRVLKPGGSLHIYHVSDPASLEQVSISFPETEASHCLPDRQVFLIMLSEAGFSVATYDDTSRIFQLEAVKL
ncbi:MAG: methyltransferase domain-containing protein [candidate division Zixibacteria bacterium]|nr:methyltransferase domain-containing protein [candidate division Zixibacteria bacterium]